MIGTSPFTALATPGSRARLGAIASSCRPPWLETIRARTPCATASRASSGWVTPLRMRGSRVTDRSQSMSPQSRSGFNSILRGLRGAHMSAVQALGEVEEPVPQVPLMTPEDGRVDRHGDPAAARRLRAPHQVGREAAVRLDVELKPEATRFRIRSGGDLLDGGRGGHADDHEELRIPGGPRGGALPVRMGQPMEGRRRDEDGHVERDTQEFGRQVVLESPPQDTRPQHDSLERRAVGPERDLVLRAPRDVVVMRAREFPPGLVLKVLQRGPLHRTGPRAIIPGFATPACCGWPVRARRAAKNLSSGPTWAGPLHSFSRFSATWCSASSVPRE